MNLYLTLLFLLVLASSCTQTNESAKSSDPVYSFEQTDTSMNKAIEIASKTIQEFDKAIKSNDPDLDRFSLKVRFPTADGGGEHMWMSNIRLSKDGYFGVVANDAVHTKAVKFGDSLLINRKDISDWMYLENGHLRGGFTIRAMRNSMQSKEEQAEFDREIDFVIED